MNLFCQPPEGSNNKEDGYGVLCWRGVPIRLLRNRGDEKLAMSGSRYLCGSAPITKLRGIAEAVRQLAARQMPSRLIL
jgi:hypothetical protein